MIPEIGHYALILALCVAVVQGVLPIYGAAVRNSSLMAIAKPAARAQFLLVLSAFCCLGYAFAVKDFSVLYVAATSNSQLPLHYRLAAIWGAHEGSLLLWMFILSIWMVAVSFFSKHLPEAMRARILGVMGLVSVGFLLFMLTVSNPFERLIPAALDGRDLNPLLQDPGMVIHPPMLYMGYVGFSVAFSFAIAALLGGTLDAAWARWSRPWTTVAWCFMTVGVAMGSGWAYYELGWGGWWFWDPVENASFMPWLAGTALMHSLAVTDKRGSFKAWSVLLAIMAFSLSLLGTFLVRSGVLTSVHAFATDPKRGLFILIFLAVVIGGSLVLYAWRAPRVGLGGSFALISREGMLLANNVLLVAALGSVLLGTLYPLFLDALDLGKISVGPPYFDTVFLPLMTPAIFLMGIGPLAQWKQASLPALAIRLRWAFGVSLGTAVVVPWLMGQWTPLVSLGLLMAFWILATIVVDLRERLLQAEGGGSIGGRVALLPRAYWGMVVAHAGVALFIVGVTMVKGFEVEQDVRMNVGETATLGGYMFHFDGTEQVKGPNYIAARGTFRVTKDGGEVTVMYPEKRRYFVQNQTMTEAAISPGLLRDLYVSLGEPLEGGAWSVRLYHKPFIDWIWGGCLVMASGGVLAVSDRRYRLAWRRKEAAVPATAQIARPTVS
jgi:cytochrome c-type biogenesis protein CcmF